MGNIELLNLYTHINSSLRKTTFPQNDLSLNTDIHKDDIYIPSSDQCESDAKASVWTLQVEYFSE